MSEARLPIYNDRNGYILGAGFSADAGLPLVKDFMIRMRDGLGWLKERGRHSEADAVEQVFDFRRRAASAAERVPFDAENIEELFSMASAAGTDDALSSAIPKAIAAILDYSIQSRTVAPTRRIHIRPDFQSPDLWDASGGPSPPNQVWTIPLYDFYTLVLAGLPGTRNAQRSDTIITFNYDLLLDDALARMRIPYSYGLSPEEAQIEAGAFCEPAPIRQGTVPLLKLHGSVNWEAPKKRTDALRILPTYSQGMSPFLAPPTWRKVFGGQLSTVWDPAVEALRTATRVIILGYSIPATDQHFKYLLGAGLQENISLRRIIFVNNGLNSGGLKARLFSVLRCELEDNLVRTVPLNIQQFLTGVPAGDETNRPLPSGFWPM